ncbi:MAG: AAA family ATPase [Magnetovibrionaceae bacterium]
MNAITQTSPVDLSAKGAEAILFFVSDDATGQVCRNAAAKAGLPADSVFPGGIATAAQALQSRQTPQRLVVDLDEAADPLSALDELSLVCDPGARVFALGSCNDVRLYRRLTSLGLEDYLPKPVDADDLAGVLMREPVAIEPEVQTPKQCEIIAVTGARGGTGASAIAANLAWMASEKRDLKTVLVDLDLTFGTQALNFDVEPGRGFREALEQPERIDGLFMERAMVHKTDQLSLLASEEPLDHPCRFDGDSLDALLERVSADADLIVLDLPRHAARRQITQARTGTHWLIVADPSLTAMRDAGRLAKLAKAGSGIDAKLVLNLVGRQPKSELKVKDFEAGAEVPVDAVCPFEPKVGSEAEARGLCWAEALPKARSVQTLEGLLDDVLGQEIAEKPGLLARLMGRAG